MRVVSPDRVIPISIRAATGLYWFASATQSVQQTAQDATSTGFLWLENPTASTKKGRLRYLSIEHNTTSEADHLSVPRIVLARFTFTGTASGAAITPAKRATADAANALNVRTAVTGMTVTLGAAVYATSPPTLGFTTSGAGVTSYLSTYQPLTEDSFVDLAAGEGLVLYQPENGTSSDGRRFVVTGLWDEY